ncbi:NTPase [Pullulanibacillus camelliae]|uniref:Probable inosine/xanthosine triphosphatase n=2 Tax=Pullulanibacillus camelliae TaxID=1707096 RepID=A0A8J2YNH6_9BACL|nr:NTPase [Pullulanibacillus camelliae]
MDRQLKIGIGTLNPAKINAVKRWGEDNHMVVEGFSVPSGVSAQPMGDEETLEGAMNRAQAVLETSDADFGMGLEGGVDCIGEDIFLCNWGALVDRSGLVLTASGARIPLPQRFKKELVGGKELGDIIDDFAKQTNVRKNQGTIGIFTNGLITREDMFHHVVMLLFGQYDYQKNIRMK